MFHRNKAKNRRTGTNMTGWQKEGRPRRKDGAQGQRRGSQVDPDTQVAL